MRQILIMAACVVGVAVAAPGIMPGLVDVGLMDRNNSSVTISSSESANLASDAAHRRRNEYRAGPNGHFLLNARMNHAYTDVLVDTGASLVAMRESDARRAGIRVKKSDFTLPIQTANGVNYAAPAVLSRVEIDDIKVFNVKVVVVPDALLHITLLGNSFLSKLDRYEISGNRLTFEN